MIRRSITNTCSLTMPVMAFAALLPATARAQNSATKYPAMAPIAEYQMPRAAEIALARSAAPAAISDSAEILVLGAKGYVTAVPGKNGFVCIIERSWANLFGEAEFWNPKSRAPLCFNAAAARSVLPAYLTRTRWVLAGPSVAKMEAQSRTDPAVIAAKTPVSGSICYMLSREGYLGDDAKGPWRPHLMFFMPRTPAAAWGANAPHSPIEADDDPNAPYSVFLVPVARWSDGTLDSSTAP